MDWNEEKYVKAVAYAIQEADFKLFQQSWNENGPNKTNPILAMDGYMLWDRAADKYSFLLKKISGGRYHQLATISFSNLMNEIKKIGTVDQALVNKLVAMNQIILTLVPNSISDLVFNENGNGGHLDPTTRLVELSQQTTPASLEATKIMEPWMDETTIRRAFGMAAHLGNTSILKYLINNPKVDEATIQKWKKNIESRSSSENKVETLAILEKGKNSQEISPIQLSTEAVFSKDPIDQIVDPLSSVNVGDEDPQRLPFRDLDNRIVEDFPREYLISTEEFNNNTTNQGKFYRGVARIKTAIDIIVNGFKESLDIHDTYGKGVYASNDLGSVLSYTRPAGIAIELKLKQNPNIRILNFAEYYYTASKTYRGSEHYKMTVEKAKAAGMDYFDYLAQKYGIDVIINRHIIVKNAAAIELPEDLAAIAKSYAEDLKNKKISRLYRIEKYKMLLRVLDFASETDTNAAIESQIDFRNLEQNFVGEINTEGGISEIAELNNIVKTSKDDSADEITKRSEAEPDDKPIHGDGDQSLISNVSDHLNKQDSAMMDRILILSQEYRSYSRKYEETMDALENFKKKSVQNAEFREAKIALIEAQIQTYQENMKEVFDDLTQTMSDLLSKYGFGIKQVDVSDKIKMIGLTPTKEAKIYAELSKYAYTDTIWISPNSQGMYFSPYFQKLVINTMPVTLKELMNGTISPLLYHELIHATTIHKLFFGEEHSIYVNGFSNITHGTELKPQYRQYTSIDEINAYSDTVRRTLKLMRDSTNPEEMYKNIDRLVFYSNHLMTISEEIHFDSDKTRKELINNYEKIISKAIDTAVQKQPDDKTNDGFSDSLQKLYRDANVVALELEMGGFNYVAIFKLKEAHDLLEAYEKTSNPDLKVKISELIKGPILSDLKQIRLLSEHSFEISRGIHADAKELLEKITKPKDLFAKESPRINPKYTIESIKEEFDEKLKRLSNNIETVYANTRDRSESNPPLPSSSSSDGDISNKPWYQRGYDWITGSFKDPNVLDLSFINADLLTLEKLKEKASIEDADTSQHLKEFHDFNKVFLAKLEKIAKENGFDTQITFYGLNFKLPYYTLEIKPTEKAKIYPVIQKYFSGNLRSQIDNFRITLDPLMNKDISATTGSPYRLGVNLTQSHLKDILSGNINHELAHEVRHFYVNTKQSQGIETIYGQMFQSKSGFVNIKDANYKFGFRADELLAYADSIKRGEYWCAPLFENIAQTILEETSYLLRNRNEYEVKFKTGITSISYEDRTYTLMEDLRKQVELSTAIHDNLIKLNQLSYEALTKISILKTQTGVDKKKTADELYNLLKNEKSSDLVRKDLDRKFAVFVVLESDSEWVESYKVVFEKSGISLNSEEANIFKRLSSSDQFIYATKNGWSHVVELLVNRDSISGDTLSEAAEVAVGNGQLDILRYFVEKLKLNYEGLEFAMASAARANQFEIVKYLTGLSQMTEMGMADGIRSSAAKNNWNMFKFLVNHANSGDMALEKAVISVCKNGDIEMVKYMVALLETKNNPKLMELALISGMREAAFEGRLEIVKYLAELSHMPEKGLVEGIHWASQDQEKEIVAHLAEHKKMTEAGLIEAIVLLAKTDEINSMEYLLDHHEITTAGLQKVVAQLKAVENRFPYDQFTDVMDLIYHHPKYKNSSNNSGILSSLGLGAWAERNSSDKPGLTRQVWDWAEKMLNSQNSGPIAQGQHETKIVQMGQAAPIDVIAQTTSVDAMLNQAEVGQSGKKSDTEPTQQSDKKTTTSARNSQEQLGNMNPMQKLAGLITRLKGQRAESAEANQTMAEINQMSHTIAGSREDRGDMIHHLSHAAMEIPGEFGKYLGALAVVHVINAMNDDGVSLETFLSILQGMPTTFMDYILEESATMMVGSVMGDWITNKMMRLNRVEAFTKWNAIRPGISEMTSTRRILKNNFAMMAEMLVTMMRMNPEIPVAKKLEMTSQSFGSFIVVSSLTRKVAIEAVAVPLGLQIIRSAGGKIALRISSRALNPILSVALLASDMIWAGKLDNYITKIRENAGYKAGMYEALFRLEYWLQGGNVPGMVMKDVCLSLYAEDLDRGMCYLDQAMMGMESYLKQIVYSPVHAVTSKYMEKQNKLENGFDHLKKLSVIWYDQEPVITTNVKYMDYKTEIAGLWRDYHIEASEAENEIRQETPETVKTLFGNLESFVKNENTNTDPVMVLQKEVREPFDVKKYSFEKLMKKVNENEDLKNEWNRWKDMRVVQKNKVYSDVDFENVNEWGRMATYSVYRIMNIPTSNANRALIKLLYMKHALGLVGQEINQGTDVKVKQNQLRSSYEKGYWTTAHSNRNWGPWNSVYSQLNSATKSGLHSAIHSDEQNMRQQIYSRGYAMGKFNTSLSVVLPRKLDRRLDRELVVDLAYYKKCNAIDPNVGLVGSFLKSKRDFEKNQEYIELRKLYANQPSQSMIGTSIDIANQTWMNQSIQKAPITWIQVYRQKEDVVRLGEFPATEHHHTWGITEEILGAYAQNFYECKY